MQQEIALLRQLQDYDLRVQAIESKTGKMREALDELISLHESLKTSLDGQRKQLDDTRAMMRDKEIELEVNEDRYAQSKNKLNAVTNTREYNALEREMDALRKMRAQLEEERDSLRDAVEGYQADVAEKGGRTAEIAAQIREEEEGIAGEASRSKEDVDALLSSREALKQKLSKPLLRRYEFIAGRRSGAAVVAAVAGACSGCHMRLPPQLYNELLRGTKIHQCPSCQRLLFHDESTEDNARA